MRGERGRYAILALALVCLAGCEPTEQLWRGREIPRTLSSTLTQEEIEGPSVIWLYRVEDCLKCQGFFEPLRIRQRMIGRGLPLVALFVGGEVDAVDARRLVARERVRYRFARLNPSEEGAFKGAGVDLPAVVVVKHGRVAAIAAPNIVANESVTDFLNRSAR